MEGKYLVTTDNWFYAPDGMQYKAAWGNVKVVGDEVLGIKTNRNSSNWFLQVGNGDDHVLIAGCQIHYAVKCENRPHTGTVLDYTTNSETGKNEYVRPSQIWIPVEES